MKAPNMENLQRSVQLSNGVVYVSHIDSFFAEELATDLDFLRFNGTKDIHLYITSPGGQVTAGIAVINCIRDLQMSGAIVTGEVRGEAQSMGFNILQACDVRIAHHGDCLMAHGITSGFVGDEENMDLEREMLTYWRDYMAELITNRVQASGKIEKTADINFWVNVMKSNKPNYFTAQSAFLLGLVDKVI